MTDKTSIFTTKDQLLYYFINGANGRTALNLSNHDYGVISSAITATHAEKPLTEKHAELCDYIIVKYAKQLRQHGISVDEAREFPWKITPVPTEHEFLCARLSVSSDRKLIKLNTPFDKKFIAKVHANSRLNMKWNKDLHCYIVAYSMCNLRLTLDMIKSHFQDGYIRYDEFTENIVSEVPKYDGIYQPTLVQLSNGTCIIAATNPALDAAVAHIPLNTDPRTIYNLSLYGIIASDELMNSPTVQFATDYITEHDDDDLHTLVSKIKSLGVEQVYMVSRYVTRRNNEIVNKFQKYDLPVIVTDNISTDIAADRLNTIVLRYTTYLTNQERRACVGKFIVLRNTRHVKA